MRVERRTGETDRYRELLNAEADSGEIRYMRAGQATGVQVHPFTVSAWDAGRAVRVRVSLSIEEAEQIAKDVSEFHTRQAAQPTQGS